jgi:hypothetical protein
MASCVSGTEIDRSRPGSVHNPNRPVVDDPLGRRVGGECEQPGSIRKRPRRQRRLGVADGFSLPASSAGSLSANQTSLALMSTSAAGSGVPVESFLGDLPTFGRAQEGEDVGHPYAGTGQFS